MVKKTDILNVFCAWCGKYMRTIDGKGISGDSHGICPDCFQIEIDKLNEQTE